MQLANEIHCHGQRLHRTHMLDEVAEHMVYRLFSMHITARHKLARLQAGPSGVHGSLRRLVAEDIACDINECFTPLGASGVVQDLQETNNPVRHAHLAAGLGPVGTVVQARGPAHARAAVVGDDLEKADVHLGAQALHGFIIQPAHLFIVNTGGEIHVAGAARMVASRAAPGGVVQIRLFGQIERVDDDHSRLHAVFFYNFAAPAHKLQVSARVVCIQIGLQCPWHHQLEQAGLKHGQHGQRGAGKPALCTLPF